MRDFTVVYKEYKCWFYFPSWELRLKKNLSLWNELYNFSLFKRLLTSTFKLAEQFTSIISLDSEFHRLILYYVRITFLLSKCCHSQVLWDKVNQITPLDFFIPSSLFHISLSPLLVLFPFQSPLSHLPHAESIWNVPWKAKLLWVQELVQTLLIATCLCFKNSTLNIIHMQWELSMSFPFLWGEMLAMHSHLEIHSIGDKEGQPLQRGSAKGDSQDKKYSAEMKINRSGKLFSQGLDRECTRKKKQDGHKNLERNRRCTC